MKQLVMILLALDLGASRSLLAQDPPAAPKLSEADRAARAVAWELAKEKQTRKCRQTCQVRLSGGASGLPDEYDLVMYYGRGGVATPGVVRLWVRRDQAQCEFVEPDEFRSGKLPRDQVDRLTRQFMYLYRGELWRRDGTRLDGLGWQSIYVTHTPSGTIELHSLDGPILLKTETMQWYANAIDVKDGIMPFALRWFAGRLLELCKDNLEIPANDRVADDLISRLSNIQTGDKELLDIHREDRESIEAEVYAEWLLRRKVPRALPEFRRLGIREHARKLELLTSGKPEIGLREILANENDELWSWALDVSGQLLTETEKRNCLLVALESCQEAIAVEFLIRALGDLPASEASLKSVRALHERPAGDRMVRVAAAEYLLSKTDADRYFSYLCTEALTTRADLNSYRDPASAALWALTRLAPRGARRQKATDVVRTLLKRLPRDAHPSYSQMRFLVDELGHHGGPPDGELLSEYAQNSSVRFPATMALARLDPERARTLAREHVKQLVAAERGKQPPHYPNQYWNAASDYMSLFVVWGDRTVVPLYEEFLQHIDLFAEPGYELTWYRERAENLLAVLRAEQVSDELSCVVDFLRRPGNPAALAEPGGYLREALTERLVAAGVDRQQVERAISSAVGGDVESSKN